MKKFINCKAASLALILAMVFMTAGCGASGGSSAGERPQTAHRKAARRETAHPRIMRQEKKS